MIIVLLGPPGTGKGTQAAAISSRFKIPHISTGDIFRANLSQGTPLGLKAKGYMEKGELVPDSLVLELVADRLSQDDCASGVLLDGFPRTQVQAERFDADLEKKGRKIDHVLLLEVPEEALVKRLSGRRVCRGCGASYHMDYSPPPPSMACPKCQGEIYQRADDQKEAILNRLKVYLELTDPLIAYYDKKALIRRVDGSLSPDAVKDLIFKALPGA
jgi:adenylate kinase